MLTEVLHLLIRICIYWALPTLPGSELRGGEGVGAARREWYTQSCTPQPHSESSQCRLLWAGTLLLCPCCFQASLPLMRLDWSWSPQLSASWSSSSSSCPCDWQCDFFSLTSDSGGKVTDVGSVPLPVCGCAWSFPPVWSEHRSVHRGQNAGLRMFF